VKKTVTVWLFLLLLCNLTPFAQAGGPPRVVHTAERPAIRVPPQEAPASLKKIYSNLAASKTDLYNDNLGFQESGPNSIGGTYFIGLPFTPTANSTVEQVQVAVQYGGSGANQVNLSIYGDSGGVPGTLLAGPVMVANLPEAGTCCTLAVANFPPVAVIGGTRYWVVADTPLTGTGSDFNGVWDFIAKPPIYLQAYSNGSGWFGFNSSPAEAAGEVLGSIP